MKIDIEGGEWAILADERLAAAGAMVIVMEWHARNSPSDDPHHAATALLERAGYTVVGIDHGTRMGRSGLGRRRRCLHRTRDR